MESAATALIAGVSAIVIALIQRSNRKAIDAVHEEVRTNHGMRAGEHIEQMGDRIGEMQDTFTVGLQNMGQVLADTLAEHTASDAANFEELRTMLKVQDERFAERAALKRLPRNQGDKP